MSTPHAPLPTAPTGSPEAPEAAATSAALDGLGPARPRRSAAGTALLWTGALIGGAVLAASAVQLADLAAARTSEESSTYQVGTAPAIEIRADGPVVVNVGRSDRVDVVSRSVTGFIGTTYDATQTDGNVTLSHQCSMGWWGSCSAGLEVSVPQGSTLLVRSSSGSIRTTDVTGDLDLSSSDGSIDVRGGRVVTARAGSGAVTVADARGAVTARSSDGSVQVTGARGDVVARSGSGSVDVSAVSGAVDASSSDGRVLVDGVSGDAVARSGSGRVEVAAVLGNVNATSSDGKVTVYGTGTPVALDISTADGRTTTGAATDPAAARAVTIRSGSGDVAYLGPR